MSTRDTVGINVGDPTRPGLLEAVLGPPAWTVEALCAQTDVEAFFPEKGGSTRAAKAVCAVCPVRETCLSYALEHGERFGIWGGLSERERRPLLRDRPASTPLKDFQESA